MTLKVNLTVQLLFHFPVPRRSLLTAVGSLHSQGEKRKGVHGVEDKGTDDFGSSGRKAQRGCAYRPP